MKEQKTWYSFRMRIEMVAGEGRILIGKTYINSIVLYYYV